MKILLTDSRMIQHPALAMLVSLLREEGHHVDCNDINYDFIAGPNAWYLIPEVINLFHSAVKTAERRMVSENTKGSIKPATPKAFEGKPRPRNASRRKDTGARKAKGQSAPSAHD